MQVLGLTPLAWSIVAMPQLPLLPQLPAEQQRINGMTAELLKAGADPWIGDKIEVDDTAEVEDMAELDDMTEVDDKIKVSSLASWHLLYARLQLGCMMRWGLRLT